MTRFVALRASGLGDLLCVVPALAALRAVGEVELWTSPWLVPFADAFRLADRTLGIDSLEAAVPRIPDAVAVDLHGRGPESHRLLLRGDPLELWSYRHAEVPASVEGPRWPDSEHEVRRWCRLVEHFGVDTSGHGLDLELPPPAWTAQRPIVLLHVGAASPARRWPATRWVRLIERLHARGVPLAVSSGPAEVERLHHIALAGGLSSDEVVPPDLDLMSFAGVVAHARAVVVCDTGVAHLATAVRRPSVVLFGPVPPSEWGPPRSSLHVALWAGRRGDPHGNRLDPGLEAIDVSQVWQALERVAPEVRDASLVGTARRVQGSSAGWLG
jgi:ADP-heptose:LPS heptosyltransferase